MVASLVVDSYPVRTSNLTSARAEVGLKIGTGYQPSLVAVMEEGLMGAKGYVGNGGGWVGKDSWSGEFSIGVQ